MESHSSSLPFNCAGAERSYSSAVAWRAACALVWAIFPGAAGATEFFSTRDENPLLRGFYVPLASDSRADSGTSIAATLSIANTLNVEERGQQALFVDGESDTVRLSVENEVSPEWHYRITLPIIRDSGGFLDSTIDHWHRWFGFSRGFRPYYPQNELDYAYSGLASVDVKTQRTRLGNASAEVGWYVADDDSHTASLWGGLAAPTGSVAQLTSDGTWDAALWGHFSERTTHWQFAAEAGALQPFGDQIFAGEAHRISAFARGAVTRSVTGDWSVRAQLDGQTGRVEHTELRFLGPSLQLTVGAVRRFAQRWRLEFGFAEDAAVNTAPDITFFIGIRN